MKRFAQVDRSAPVLLLLGLYVPMVLSAQDFEPRQYANAPIGVNFLIAAPAVTHLGLPMDPAIPLTDPPLRTTGAALGYARVLRVAGQSASSAFRRPAPGCKGRRCSTVDRCHALCRVSPMPTCGFP